MERTRKLGKPALLLGLVLMLLMLVAACGEEDENLGVGANVPPTPTQAPAGTPTPEPIVHPQGDNDVVIKVEHTGGFVPQEYVVTRMPHFVLYGDGSVITQGPQIAIYPAPALPNLQQGVLTEEGIQMILEAARDAGLLDGDKQYNLDMIADAATTVFTISADGETHTVSVYALESVNDEIANDMIPEDEVEARQKIAEFEAMLLDYMGWLPEEAIAEAQSEYPLEALQVVAIPRDLYPVMDDTIENGEMDWPLETPLAEIGAPYEFIDEARCVVVDGEELDTLVEALNDANQQTTWISDEGEYGLLLRPMLPGEEGCSLPQM